MDGFDVPGGKKATPTVVPLRSPSPSENLAIHPYFRAEYALPVDDPDICALISRRRMRASASAASSSPAPSPVPEKPAPSGRGSRRKKNQAQLKNMAGLVAGDSDSSALTQESGDESAPTPTTNPDAGTEYAEGDNEREPSPGMYHEQSSRLCSCSHALSIESTVPSKRKGTKGRRNSTATRGKSNTSRGVKKRKR